MGISSAMQGNDGSTSSMRVCLLITVFIVVAVFVAANIIAWIHGVHDIIDFKPEMKWIIGLAFLGKVGQSLGENLGIKISTPPSAPTEQK